MLEGYEVRSEFLREAIFRGYLNQCTDLESLDKFLLDSNFLTLYLGFDCTAPCLHVGSLVPMMFARMFQRYGHKVIILVGGGTTKVGDPSGKTTDRPILDESVILGNVAAIKSLIAKFLRFGDSSFSDAIIANNDLWLSELVYVDFLRTVGSKFSVNRMLDFESVKSRLAEGKNLSFLEFNYMLMQAYDFVELARRYDCCLQIGGSDQWGNIVSGVELGRKFGFDKMYGITTPLVVTASGKKMGKTEKGAIWLDENFCSIQDYWQYFRNVDDRDVGRFLRMFTELSESEILSLECLGGEELNHAKKLLANSATEICHGSDAAERVSEGLISSFEEQDDSKLVSHRIDSEVLGDGISLLHLLKKLDCFGLGVSECKRLVAQGACRINDKPETDQNFVISPGIFVRDAGGMYIKLSLGKKKLIRVELNRS